MMPGLVSVVIPAYNASAHVRHAVASVVGQTYRNIEVIVVDDGSTDDTRSRLEPFGSDSRFRYIFQRNGGAAAARNTGIRVAQGDYVAFNDADDVWTSMKLAKQMALFENAQVQMVYAGIQLIDENGGFLPTPPNRTYRGSDLYRRLIIRNFIPTSTVVVSRALLRTVGYFDERLRRCDDYNLWLRMSLVSGMRIDFTDERLVLHRVWPGQMTRDALGFAEESFAVQERSLCENSEQVSALLRYYVKSHCFARRSRNLFRIGKNFDGWCELWHALRYWPANIKAWKTLAQIVLMRTP